MYESVLFSEAVSVPYRSSDSSSTDLTHRVTLPAVSARSHPYSVSAGEG